MYDYIVNPKTGRKVSIRGKKGKQILKQYIKNLDKEGGACLASCLLPLLLL